MYIRIFRTQVSLFRYVYLTITYYHLLSPTITYHHYATITYDYHLLYLHVPTRTPQRL